MPRSAMPLVLAVLAVFLLTGCVNKFRIDAYEPPVQSLSISASAYVMLTADGSYGAEKYTGSGRMTSIALMNAVSTYLNNVNLVSSLESQDEALHTARREGMTYVFQPIILHWEVRATEWSGKTDKLTIKTVVWHAKTGEALTSTVSRASTKWATLGGDHPQDLLPKMMKTAVDKMFSGS